jgi:hypothetical protein
MTIVTFYELLKAKGVELTVEGSNLRYRGPAGVMTPELMELLRLWKPGIVAMLQDCDVPSHIPGIVWSKRGGVKVADPPPVRPEEVEDQ